MVDEKGLDSAVADKIGEYVQLRGLYHPMYRKFLKAQSVGLILLHPMTTVNKLLIDCRRYTS